MKSTVSTVVPGALALALCLPGCWRAPSEAGGPSSHFRALDANRDGDVDRYEWENIQGAAFPLSFGFRYADCDADGRLTWHEYFTGYMHLKRCPTPYLYEDARAVQAAFTSASASSAGVAASTHPDDAQGEDWQTGPLVVRAEEPVQIYEALPSDDDAAIVDVPTLLPRPQPPRPGRHSETDLAPGALQRVRFSSRPLTDTILVSHYDPREKIPGNEVRRIYPLVACKLANDNPELRITLADLQVVWRAHGREYRTRALKTLWANPGTAQVFHVWFSGPVDSAECRLLHARGQPAG